MVGLRIIGDGAAFPASRVQWVDGVLQICVRAGEHPSDVLRDCGDEVLGILDAELTALYASPEVSRRFLSLNEHEVLVTRDSLGGGVIGGASDLSSHEAP
jgi:hypothetical protein